MTGTLAAQDITLRPACHYCGARIGKFSLTIVRDATGRRTVTWECTYRASCPRAA